MTPTEAHAFVLDEIELVSKKKSIEYEIKKPEYSTDVSDDVTRVPKSLWCKVIFTVKDESDSMALLELARYLNVAGIQFDVGGSQNTREWELDWSFRYTGTDSPEWLDRINELEEEIFPFLSQMAEKGVFEGADDSDDHWWFVMMIAKTAHTACYAHACSLGQTDDAWDSLSHDQKHAVMHHVAMIINEEVTTSEEFHKKICEIYFSQGYKHGTVDDPDMKRFTWLTDFENLSVEKVTSYELFIQVVQSMSTGLSEDDIDLLKKVIRDNSEEQ